MESFVYDAVTADNKAAAVGVVCQEGAGGVIREALGGIKDIRFGDYRSGYTIDYRLNTILDELLGPFREDIVLLGASVDAGEADCPTGGILGMGAEGAVSAEENIFSRDGYAFVTRPGRYAFALKGDLEEAEKIKKALECPGYDDDGREKYLRDVIGISRETEILYKALMESGREFIFISDGSGGRKGAAAVRGELVLLSDTKRRAAEIRDLHGFRKIGVMGGTFDPVHYGHLLTAEAVREKLGLEKVVFIPTGETPYKKHGVTGGPLRYVMTALAVEGNGYFCVSSLETAKKGFSYTADTVAELKKHCDEDAEIVFITGSDVLDDISGWKDFDRLSGMCSFAAVTRPGYEAQGAVERLRKRGVNIRLVEAMALDISSSGIRGRVSGGGSIKYLLPEAVEKYIDIHGFYRLGEYDGSLEKILKKLI